MSKRKPQPVQKVRAIASESDISEMIILTEPIDLAKGVGAKNVLAYLTQCFRQASEEASQSEQITPKTKKDKPITPTKRSKAAETIFNIAHNATALLGELMKDHPHILEPRLKHSPPLAFPILLERKNWPKYLINQAGVQRPNKTRADAAPEMTLHMKTEALRLFTLWQEWQTKFIINAEDDRDNFAKINFIKILSSSSEAEAVRQLPAPSLRTFKLWWDLEEAILKRDFESIEIGFWFVHPVILKAAKKANTEPDRSTDPDKARHTVAKNYQAAFIQELRKLVNKNVK